jgi:hypothetical protein
MTIIQLTPAQRLALNGFLSLLASAFVVTISAVYQYYAAGNVSVSALLNFALLTFFITFGKALHDHVPSRAREAIQSAEGIAQKAQETTQTIASSIAPVVQQNQEAIQKVHEVAQTLATSIAPAPQSQETTQIMTTSIAPALQSCQGTTPLPQALSVPLVVIHLPPGSSLVPPPSSPAPPPETKDQVTTGNLAAT